MSSDTDYHFGLDSDLANKRKALYDSNLEAEIKQWIEQTIGESLGGDFMAALKSGVILCKLGNKLGGKCKSSPASAPFIQMENINSFLNFAKSCGVVTSDMFMTVDLFEAKNPNQVLQTLSALKRITGGGKAAVTAPKSAGNVFDSTAGKTSPSYCGQCGERLAAGTKFCGACGNKI